MGWKQLTETARRLKFQKELRPSQSKRVTGSVAFLRKVGMNGKQQKHQLFLDRALEISRVYFMLCAIAFSQNQIVSTQTATLDSLLERIASNRDNDKILCPRFHLYATRLRVPATARFQADGQDVTTLGELHDETEGISSNTNSRGTLSIRIFAHGTDQIYSGELGQNT